MLECAGVGFPARSDDPCRQRAASSCDPEGLTCAFSRCIQLEPGAACRPARRLGGKRSTGPVLLARDDLGVSSCIAPAQLAGARRLPYIPRNARRRGRSTTADFVSRGFPVSDLLEDVAPGCSSPTQTCARSRCSPGRSGAACRPVPDAHEGAGSTRSAGLPTRHESDGSLCLLVQPPARQRAPGSLSCISRARRGVISRTARLLFLPVGRESKPHAVTRTAPMRRWDIHRARH